MIRLFRPARWLDPAMDRAHRDIERQFQTLETLPEYRADQAPPAAASRGRLIALTDAGYTPAYSDGAVWRRLSDNSPL